MRILVTGASGNVGQYVTEHLLKMGERVVTAGTDIQKLKSRFGDKVETVYVDFTNEGTFGEALNHVRKVFLIRPPHLSKPEELYPFIEAMKRHNVEFVSFLSLMGVEKNTLPPHHKIEKYIESSGIAYSHIRPGFFMQNLSGIHSVEIREKDEIFVPAGKSKTSFIDAKDIGLAVATVLYDCEKYRNTSFTITGGQALDYYEIADILSKVTDRKITYANPGFMKYRKYYINQRGLDKKFVNVTVALYIMTRMGTAKEVTDDFLKLTGKNPRSFEEFARDNSQFFMKKEDVLK